MAAELDDKYARELQSLRDELGGSVNTKLRTIDPVFVANKDKIEAIAETHNLSLDQATAIFSDLNGGKNKVHQPGPVKAPGRVGDSGRGGGGGKAKPQIQKMDATSYRVFQQAGLTEEEIAGGQRLAAQDDAATE